MRFKLKDFQVDASANVMAALGDARHSISTRGRTQAIVLSSPTGSGKTVIIAEMIERLLYGHDGSTPDPNAVFLWLSDSPELNAQSKKKLHEASDQIPRHRLVTIENEFSGEFFTPGFVYFLNTQKLGAKALLTQHGNDRQWTIWQTIENTAKRTPLSFYLIIDEAHRGMRDAGRSQAAQTRRENDRLTIVQKFIKGDPTAGLSPVPLIVGISATPDRFNKVLEGTPRSRHPVDVLAEEVRSSGLIKDRIKLAVAKKGEDADWSMLAESGKRLYAYSDEWANYCQQNKISPPVIPILVVQVENGNDRVPTRTNLERCMKVLETACGSFPPGAIAHCFDEDRDIQVGTYLLRKVDASRIQEDDSLRVVFFKTALTTGWDCPRAEVMMSFRKAIDDTLIAQLVGRMVRTPLAKRVESNDVLNSVSLSLPYYDEEAVALIVKKLQDPESGGAEVVSEREMVVYRRDSEKERLFAALASMPTYVVDRPKRIAETSRLIKLTRLLTFNGLSENAQGKARRFVIDQLLQQRDRLKKTTGWSSRLEGSAKIPVKEFTIEYGQWRMDQEPASYFIEATEENVFDLFTRCGGVLGEGLHESYINRPDFRGDVNVGRLELFCILQDEKAPKLVQEACGHEFERLWDECKDDILTLPQPLQEKFKDLRRRGGKVAAELMTIVSAIEVKKETPKWDNHLYVDDAGKFGWNAGTWERDLLEIEQNRTGFVAFLRNHARRQGSLCIPYGTDEDRAFYPDMLVFRKVKNSYFIDILEPHGDQFADGLLKAQGLARYAKAHGSDLGRIEIIRFVKGRPERLDLQNDRVRNSVLRANTVEQLNALYTQLG